MILHVPCCTYEALYRADALSVVAAVAKMNAHGVAPTIAGTFAANSLTRRAWVWLQHRIPLVHALALRDPGELLPHAERGGRVNMLGIERRARLRREVDERHVG